MKAPKLLMMMAFCFLLSAGIARADRVFLPGGDVFCNSLILDPAYVDTVTIPCQRYDTIRQETGNAIIEMVVGINESYEVLDPEDEAYKVTAMGIAVDAELQALEGLFANFADDGHGSWREDLFAREREENRMAMEAWYELIRLLVTANNHTLTMADAMYEMEVKFTALSELFTEIIEVCHEIDKLKEKDAIRSVAQFELDPGRVYRMWSTYQTMVHALEYMEKENADVLAGVDRDAITSSDTAETNLSALASTERGVFWEQLYHRCAAERQNIGDDFDAAHEEYQEMYERSFGDGPLTRLNRGTDFGGLVRERYDWYMGL